MYLFTVKKNETKVRNEQLKKKLSVFFCECSYATFLFCFLFHKQLILLPLLLLLIMALSPKLMLACLFPLVVLKE